MRFIKFLIVAFVFISCKSSDEVDTIVHNGIVYTVNDSFAVAEAFAITDGKIIAVGTSKEILKSIKPKKLLMQKDRQFTLVLLMLMHIFWDMVNHSSR